MAVYLAIDISVVGTARRRPQGANGVRAPSLAGRASNDLDREKRRPQPARFASE
jgi:hypothetical protein